MCEIYPKEKRNVIAIIQARLGSSRLPLKSLISLHGLPLIDWVVSRVARSSRISGLVVAVPDTDLDSVLADHLISNGIPCIHGPENDVLARFCMAAQATNANLVVRVCADNPFIWWEAIDRLIDFYDEFSPDYAYNHIPRGNLWPDGFGAEIISRELLDNIDSRASFPSQREHCLNYIWDNRDNFRIATFNPQEKWLQRPELKFDIDTPQDFAHLAKLPVSPQSGAREIVDLFPA